MQNKLIVLLAAVSALVALTEAATSTMSCVPAMTTTFIVGMKTKCTCAQEAGAAASTEWKVDGVVPSSGVSASPGLVYDHTFKAGENGKKITCSVTVGSAADTPAEKTIKSEDPKQPEIKCDPAKVEKDKESTCTCTNKNTATATKYTFSVDGGAEKDGDQGDKKDGYKVKITKEAKVTCMVYFDDTVKTKASAEAKIELSGGSDSGSASLHSALSLVVMMFASIIVSIL